MEDNSPYQASKVAPVAAPSDRLDWRDAPPGEITSRIKHMTILLVLAGLWTLSMALVMLYNMPKFNGIFLAAALVLVSVYMLAAYGVHKRSRTVATIVLVLWALSALGTILEFAAGEGNMSGVGFTAVFGFVAIRGTLATYRYHRHMADVRNRPQRSRLSDDPAFAPKLDASSIL